MGVCNCFNWEHFGEFSFPTQHIVGLLLKRTNFSGRSVFLLRHYVGLKLIIEFLIKDSSKFYFVEKKAGCINTGKFYCTDNK